MSPGNRKAPNPIKPHDSQELEQFLEAKQASSIMRDNVEPSAKRDFEAFSLRMWSNLIGRGFEVKRNRFENVAQRSARAKPEVHGSSAPPENLFESPIQHHRPSQPA